MHELNWTSVDQLQQPLLSPVSGSLFRSALWATDLWRVDVGKPDLYSVVADSVSVDHAVFLERHAAQPEAATTTWITASSRVDRT